MEAIILIICSVILLFTAFFLRDVALFDRRCSEYRTQDDLAYKLARETSSEILKVLDAFKDESQLNSYTIEYLNPGLNVTSYKPHHCLQIVVTTNSLSSMYIIDFYGSVNSEASDIVQQVRDLIINHKEFVSQDQ